MLLAGAALAVSLVRTPGYGDVADRFVFVSNFSQHDATDDKEVNAPCPDGTKLVGGGGGIQHGNDTPSIATYLDFPVGQQWNVQAHETDPEQEGRFPWTLFSVAVCFRR